MCMVTVYVPALVIVTSSAPVGTWFGDQFSAVCQTPPAMLVQTTDAPDTGRIPMPMNSAKQQAVFILRENQLLSPHGTAGETFRKFAEIVSMSVRPIQPELCQFASNFAEVPVKHLAVIAHDQ